MLGIPGTETFSISTRSTPAYASSCAAPRDRVTATHQAQACPQIATPLTLAAHAVLLGGRRYYPAMGPRHAHDDVDLRRRCVAYDQWLAHHPDRMSFVEMWADQNFEMISGL